MRPTAAKAWSLAATIVHVFSWAGEVVACARNAVESDAPTGCYAGSSPARPFPTPYVMVCLLLAPRMDQAELFELWQDNKDRPAFVRNYREEIHDHVDVNEEIPAGSIPQVRDWLGRFKGTVTAQLDPSPDENDNTDDAEGSA